MSKFIAVLFLVLNAFISTAQLLPAYNNAFYNSVLSAAEGVGEPFLLLQGYTFLKGVKVPQPSSGKLIYHNHVYYVNEKYINPGPGTDNVYYLNHTNYKVYGITDFSSTWPQQIPNVFYHKDSFCSYVDCVGYGTRLLSAVGSAQNNANAYMQLISMVRAANRSPFAATGYVASAYEIAAAIPTLPVNASAGWTYVSGGVLPSQVDSYNHILRKDLGNYSGRSKGSFYNAAAGDVLAFGYPPGQESNGHFMVLSASPVQIINPEKIKDLFPNTSAPPLINNLSQIFGKYHVYAVEVYDCTGQNIHFNDSRKYTSGIGHGTIFVLTDIITDTPRGFVFGPQNLSNGQLKTFMLGPDVYVIAVGRYMGK